MTPFIEPIGDWTSPYREDLNLALVSGSQEDFALQELTLELMPKVYDAVNRLQRVAFKVNPYILPQLFRALSAVQALRAPAIKKGAAGDWEEYHAITQRITQVSGQIMMIKQLAKHGSLYFAVTLDYRGRMYYRGGITTPQGSDFEKATFCFAESKPLGEKGRAAIALHYANSYGLDKESMVDRLTWAYGEGLAIAFRIAAGEFPVEADKPFQAFTAACELVRIAHLETDGHVVSKIESWFICHQDGTCNGLQHGAAMTGDMKTAVAVNCVPSSYHDKPSDVYGLAASAMHKMCKTLRLTKLADAMLNIKSREFMKFPVMVTGYGAGTKTAIRDMVRDLRKHGEEAAAKEATENDLTEDAMDFALNETAGAMVSLNMLLQDAIAPVAHRPIYWLTKDGLCVRQACRSKTEREYRAEGTAWETRVDKIEEQAQINAISPNIVHSIDWTHLRLVLIAANTDIAAVHDSVGSHAATFWDVAVTIREQFIITHEYDVVHSLCKQNDLPLLDVKTGEYTTEQVRTSTYFFS